MEDTAVQFETDPGSGAEINDRFLTLVGVAGGVMNVVAFSAVGYIALGSVAYGAIAGAFGGVGSYLFLPWFMGISAVQEQSEADIGFAAASEQVSASSQLGVLGAGLEAGTILMLAVGFALEEPDLLIGSGAPLAAMLVVYVTWSMVLDF